MFKADRANMKEALMTGCDLTNISLEGAILDKADLTDAKGITDDLLASLASWSGTRLESDSEIVKAFTDICSKFAGVEDAAEYTSGQGVHPVVVMKAGSVGLLHSWHDKLPENVQALSFRTAQLIGCVEEEKILIETCYYYGPRIERYQYQVTIRLANAQTGKTLASETVKGPPPRLCKKTERSDTKTLVGTPVKFQEVQSWILKDVSP